MRKTGAEVKNDFRAPLFFLSACDLAVIAVGLYADDTEIERQKTNQDKFLHIFLYLYSVIAKLINKSIRHISSVEYYRWIYDFSEWFGCYWQAASRCVSDNLR